MEQPASRQVNDETLDFIFDQIKGAPAEQNQVWNTLDSKVTSIFSVGSAVVGLAGFSVTKTGGTSLGVAVLLGVALLAYGVAAGSTLRHLWPATARYASYGDTLWPDAWNQPVREIKHGIVEDITEGVESNRKVLQRKANTLRIVVAAVAAETLLIGIAFIVRLAGG